MIRRISYALLFFTPCKSFLPAPPSFQTKKSPCNASPKQQETALNMAVTPIGPFCPFRSETAISLDDKMSKLNTAAPTFAMDMTRLQLDMQMGNAPDPEKLREVANGINVSVEDWESLIARLSLSDDFQTKEYSKLTQAHLANFNQTVDEIAIMMRWQADCMRAMAANSPPPMPPPGVDIVKMMDDAQKAQSGEGVGPPPMTAMANAEKITRTPFLGTEAAFESDTVKEEYDRLCRDHDNLIEFGGRYAAFDPVGKLAYLDEVEKIEERWDVFFARFSLLGQLDKEFVRQCDLFLKSMGLDEAEFKKLLKEAHSLMREDAERERGRKEICTIIQTFFL